MDIININYRDNLICNANWISYTPMQILHNFTGRHRAYYHEIRPAHSHLRSFLNSAELW